MAYRSIHHSFKSVFNDFIYKKISDKLRCFLKIILLRIVWTFSVYVGVVFFSNLTAKHKIVYHIMKPFISISHSIAYKSNSIAFKSQSISLKSPTIARHTIDKAMDEMTVYNNV